LTAVSTFQKTLANKIILPTVPRKGTIAPIMGTTNNQINLSSVLFGKTRQAVLALFYSHPDESFYLRQVVRAIGMGQGAVQRELKQLTDAGIIEKSKLGRQVYYRANIKCPIFPELQGLIIKTAGLVDVLCDALGPLLEKIKVAFVYGSFAKSSANSRSDVDMMVIGSCSFGDVVDAIHICQDKLAREINPSVYPVDEFRKKVAAKHHFIKTVLNSPKIFLIGTEDELGRLAQ